MREKISRLLKDTAIFAIGSLGAKAIMFFLVPLYTHVLTTAEYGTADLVTVFSMLIVPVVSLSIEKAVIRFGMKPDVQKAQALLSALFILAFAAAATLCLMPAFGLYHAIAPWRAYLAMHIILSVASEITRAYLKVKNLNRVYSIIGIGQAAVLALTNLLLLTVFRLGVRGYLTANILSLMFCVALCAILGGIHRDLRNVRMDWRLLGQMIRYSAPLIFSGISWWILHSSDKVMIEWMVGATALGLYTAATKIPSLIHIIIGVFNQAWGLSSIREAEAENDQGYYAAVFDRFSILLFGAAMVFIAASKPFMSVYVGQAFRASWVYTPFLLFAAVFYSIFSFMGSLYCALQHTVHDMRLSLLCAAMNVVINYFGIRQFGIGGAVIGTAASYCIVSIISIFDIRRYIRFDIHLGRYIVHNLLILLSAGAETFTDCHGVVSLACLAVFSWINRREIQEAFGFLRMLASGPAAQASPAPEAARPAVGHRPRVERVSIIIPVYNVAQYLEEALDSVIHQSYGNLEILIVDDGSEDGSGAICDEYAARDSRIRVFHQPNRGLSAARNVGLEAMTGQALMFLDSDDAFHPDIVQTLLDGMNREGADLAICRFTNHSTTGRMKLEDIEGRPAVPAALPGVYDRLQALRALADVRINISVWNKLYRRELWDATRFPEGRVFEDLETAFPVFDRAERVLMIGQCLYLHRLRGGSISFDISEGHILDWEASFERYISFISAHVPDIFSQEQLYANRQIWLNTMMDKYAAFSLKYGRRGRAVSRAMRQRIMDTASQWEIRRFGLRTRIAHRLLCHCPRLFGVFIRLQRRRPQ